MRVVAAPKKYPNVHACFQFASNQTICFAHVLNVFLVGFQPGP